MKTRHRAAAAAMAAIAVLSAALILAPTRAEEGPPPVGEPRVGDAVRYDWTRSDGDDGGELAFRWVGPGTRHGPRGQELATQVAWQYLHPPDGQIHNGTVAFRPGSVDPVATTDHRTQGSRTDLVAARTEWRFVVEHRSYRPSPPPVTSCLLRAGWQGRAVEDLDGARASSICPSLAGDATVEPVGTRTLQDRTAWGYRLPGEQRDLTVWLTPELPYPLSMTVARDGPTERFTLDAYERGDRPWTMEGSGGSSEPVEVRDGPLPRWGVIEGDPGIYAFPPSEAIAAIGADPQLDGFHDYLDDHPDARVVAYHHWHDDRYVHPNPAYEERIWRFVFNTPEGEGYEVWTRRIAEAPVGPGQDIVHDNNASARALPGYDHLPSTTVRIDDVVDLWHAVTGTTSAIDQIGATLQTDLGPRHDLHRSGEIVVGRYRERAMVDDETDGIESRSTFSGVAVDSVEGHLQATYETGSCLCGSVDPLGDGTGDPSAPASPPVRGSLLSPSTWSVGGAAVLGLVTYLLRHPVIRGLAVVAHRIRDVDPRDHPARRAILEVVVDRPGVHESAIRREVGVGNGTLQYHLQVLVEADLVTRVKVGGYTRYFETGSMAYDEMRRQAVLLSGSAASILEAVRDEPGLSQRAIADRVDIDEAAVHRQLRRLEEEGLIDRRREGRSNAVYPASTGG